MTTFQRNGYWRTSVYGVEHWVTGHSVSRDDWERSGSGSSESHYFRELLHGARAGLSYSATYVNPNADCPVCGEQVFFYQNASGSRVFFDELGPPWPKHPCTDNSKFSQASSRRGRNEIQPERRSDTDISFVERWLNPSGYRPEGAFGARYGLSPWIPLRVEARFKRRSLVVLQRLGSGKPSRLYLRAQGLPLVVDVGTLVHYFRGWISFFDPASNAPVEAQVIRLSGPEKFVDALLEEHRASEPGV
jgi:hypothetical protein